MSGAMIAVGIGAAAAAAAGSIYASNQQSKASKAAADRQAKASADALKEQQMQFNKENQNEVDTSGILAGNTQSDTASTMLTGPKGVGGKLNLGGGSSLLGG